MTFAYAGMMTERSQLEKQQLIAFGNNLRRLRLARGLTQEQLAFLSGLNRSYYTEIETGKRNISLLNMLRLAYILDVKPGALLEFDAYGEEA